MNTNQRILVLRLLERKKRDPLYADRIGIRINLAFAAPKEKELSTPITMKHDTTSAVQHTDERSV